MADGDPRFSRRQFLAACGAPHTWSNDDRDVDGLVGVAPLVADGMLYAAVGDSVYAIGESW